MRACPQRDRGQCVPVPSGPKGRPRCLAPARRPSVFCRSVRRIAPAAERRSYSGGGTISRPVRCRRRPRCSQARRGDARQRSRIQMGTGTIQTHPPTTRPGWPNWRFDGDSSMGTGTRQLDGDRYTTRSSSGWKAILLRELRMCLSPMGDGGGRLGTGTGHRHRAPRTGDRHVALSVASPLVHCATASREVPVPMTAPWRRTRGDSR